MTGGLPNVKLGLYSGRAKSSVHPNVVREEPVARTAQKNGGREPAEVSEERGDVGLFAIMATGIELGTGLDGSRQDIVQAIVYLPSVARSREVERASVEDNRRRQGKSFVAGS